MQSRPLCETRSPRGPDIVLEVAEWSSESLPPCTQPSEQPGQQTRADVRQLLLRKAFEACFKKKGARRIDVSCTQNLPLPDDASSPPSQLHNRKKTKNSSIDSRVSLQDWESSMDLTQVLEAYKEAYFLLEHDSQVCFQVRKKEATLKKMLLSQRRETKALLVESQRLEILNERARRLEERKTKLLAHHSLLKARVSQHKREKRTYMRNRSFQHEKALLAK